MTVRHESDVGFSAFVTARSANLFRTAYLVIGMATGPGPGAGFLGSRVRRVAAAA